MSRESTSKGIEGLVRPSLAPHNRVPAGSDPLIVTEASKPCSAIGESLRPLQKDYQLSIRFRIHLILIVLSISFLAPIRVGGSIASSSDKVYDDHYEYVLGTSLEIKVVASSAAQSAKAEQSVLSEIDREEHILSSWDSGSEFSAWFRTHDCPVHVSPELFEVLGLFDRWRSRTNGALDPSAEAVTRVWKRAAAENHLPSQMDLDNAVKAVRKAHWSLDPATQSATHLSDTPLALNSFVKSYIAGRAAQAALKSGARGVVVNIGGDLVVRGDWQELVDIADPRSDAENSAPIARLLLRGRAVATSGDYRRGVEINGRRYSHIVDPRTGLTAGEIISSTVIAPSPADAGALATALSVLTPQESARLVATSPGAEYLLVMRNGERIESAGWKAFEAPLAFEKAAFRLTTTRAAELPQVGSLWDPKFELNITIELNLIEGYRVHRPYLAVWIENESHAPVRTVALWFRKYKYLNELRAWTQIESKRSTSEDTHVINSVSSATRPPGKYSFKWDGKDDFGNPVKEGRYTVMIEAVREHGSYQLMHQEMDFNGSPKQVQLPGAVEIASAILDYRKSIQ